MTYRGTGIDVAWIQDKTFSIMRRENFSFIDFESQLLCTSIDINIPVHGAWNRKGQIDLIFGISYWVILFDLVNSRSTTFFIQFSSVAQSCPTLQPHELQHTRPLCPSQTPRVYSNPCPSSWWCHPTISSSVIPFSYCPQSLPASGFFQWVTSLHEVAKVLEFQLQCHSFQWTPRTDLFRWTGWISMQYKGLSRVFSNTTVQKHQFFGAPLSSESNSYIHTWPLEKP